MPEVFSRCIIHLSLFYHTFSGPSVMDSTKKRLDQILEVPYFQNYQFLK